MLYAIIAAVLVTTLAWTGVQQPPEKNTGLKGKRIAFLATDGFEQSELMEPRKALDAAGATTVLISIKKGTIKAWHNDAWGEALNVDQVVSEAKMEDFDCLVLPGGVINPDKLRMDLDAVQFVKSFIKAGKPVAAICHGPWLLVEADAVRGKKITSWPSVKTDIKNAGGNWVDEEVVEDHGIITSRKPDDITAFNRKIMEVLVRSAQK